MKDITTNSALIGMEHGGIAYLGAKEMKALSTEEYASVLEHYGNSSEMVLKVIPQISDLNDFDAIKRQVRANEDVTLAFLVNEIELPNGYHEARDAVVAAELAAEQARAVMSEKVSAALQTIEQTIEKRWAERVNAGVLTQEQQEELKGWTLTDKRVGSPRGNYLGVKTAERVYQACVAAWKQGTRKMVGSDELKNDGLKTISKRDGRWHSNNYHIQIYEDRVKIGCQTIPRYIVMAIGHHYGWVA